MRQNSDTKYSPKVSIRLGLLIYDSFIQAKADRVKIAAYAHKVDQLNLVLREEGNMDDPELLAIHPRIKVYAGVAWTNIHERRVKENFYKDLNILESEKT